MSEKTRLLVLISGGGSNLQAILDACEQDKLAAKVVGVVSNRASAYGLQRAAQAGVPHQVFPYKKVQARQEYDQQLAELCATYQPDYIVLAGWMHLLGQTFLDRFAGRVINLHPALPGTYPGTHSIERAFADWQAGKISQSGVMVHLVPDEGIDDGPLLQKRIVPFYETDTLAEFEARVHQTEHQLLVDALNDLIKKSAEK